MYQIINNWTKEEMKIAINTKMFSYPSKSDGMCMYLAPDGNRCAIGVFIPCGHPAEKSEAAVTFVLNGYPELKAIMPLESHALSYLQAIHDSTPMNKDPRPELLQWIEENVQD